MYNYTYLINLQICRFIIKKNLKFYKLIHKIQNKKLKLKIIYLLKYSFVINL